MCEEWMPCLTLPLTLEQFHQLPRNAAYKYEFLGGQVYLTPRAKHFHALLDLQPLEGEAGISLRSVRAEDWAHLETIFVSAFRRIQPFGSLDEATQHEAARQCLKRTCNGGDGPWIETASFVAVAPETPEQLIGAILITLLPDGDPTDWDSYHWLEPPPEDCVQRRLGRPHLTWIFVSNAEACQGVGTTLLAAAVRELLALGFTQLASTFLLGNESSMLWHWRNGFRLLPYPGSRREMKKRWQQRSV
jgi:hypothetical protein